MYKCDEPRCKFWSEMIAGCDGYGPVKALCLNKESPKHLLYTYWGCLKKVEGDPIDLPGNEEAI
jgi:hypothetical protein